MRPRAASRVTCIPFALLCFSLLEPCLPELGREKSHRFNFFDANHWLIKSEISRSLWCKVYSALHYHIYAPWLHCGAYDHLTFGCGTCQETVSYMRLVRARMHGIGIPELPVRLDYSTLPLNSESMPMRDVNLSLVVDIQ
ncbi:small secreted protein [Laccaria bicolor S238N-H82]|uniref:Small secreted protein n=1 Tax=Laccaria bicolor (strain S238N-H82 / ATCC MYA-4686) TaxID=486041 RepID=B0D5Y0_LACBS|nr:small secreted protein [Laccaria bicolor S238N-H82]EDR09846.1 small secreted protein [Laccaria bicolor S238N-H82]|eukprot:XP_001879231.1 small secreted protein [Laccaria bicolor S238N-H82]